MLWVDPFPLHAVVSACPHVCFLGHSGWAGRERISALPLLGDGSAV